MTTVTVLTISVRQGSCIPGSTVYGRTPLSTANINNLLNEVTSVSFKLKSDSAKYNKLSILMAEEKLQSQF